MPLRRPFMEWLVVAVVLALGIPFAAWLAQERMIFYPQPVAATAHLPAHAAPFSVTADDGTVLRGWIARGTPTPAPAVLYFGGNAEEVSWTLADARWPRAWTIVALNYRGYGGSGGRPGERELAADGLAIFDAVAASDGIDAARIVTFGRSLGTAVATHVAASRPIAGVVLVSPFDSLTAVGSHHYPWLPVSLLLRHRFEAIAEAPACRMPLLAIVGEDDTIIPVARSRALYDAWAGPKSWYAIPRMDHNMLGTTAAFWRAIARFLQATQYRETHEVPPSRRSSDG
jgi:fermentation-respiration switch protein FrsA (DUF1100 family)